jgi:hypothetical protein
MMLKDRNARITCEAWDAKNREERAIFTRTLTIQAHIIAMLLNGFGDGEDLTWASRRRRIEQQDLNYNITLF